MGYCDWADTNQETKDYHDKEWGIPVHDDRLMFEYLSLECLQCGLSWGTIIKKREIFRKCFDNFDYDTVAQYTELDVDRILNTDGMLRSRNKINAIINNAKCYRKMRKEYGSFCKYLWAYSDGKTIIYDRLDNAVVPVSNGLSKLISRNLKKRGFKYIGAITIYSHLQACGIINDHSKDCPLYDYINKKYPIILMKPDNEIVV